MRTGRKHTGGMTLVEMLASLGLLALLMLSAVTLLLSFFNAFSHLRQLQSDQTIADTLAEKTAFGTSRLRRHFHGDFCTMRTHTEERICIK